MPGHLKYLIKKGKKIYTLKGNIDGQETKDAHYKFIRLKKVSE